MSLQNSIRSEIKDAMLKKETLRLNVLRGMIAAFTNELVAQKKKPQEELPDEDALNVIRRLVKQRKESIEQFIKGKREDLAEIEKEELVILEKYLPQMMSKDDIRKVAEVTKAKLGVQDKSKLGQLVGAVMKELKGKADGRDVKEVVDNLF